MTEVSNEKFMLLRMMRFNNLERYITMNLVIYSGHLIKSRKL